MKVLVIRFSSIGDIVVCTPIIRALKLQKNAAVHVLTKRSFSPVLQGNPYIEKVIHLEDLETYGFQHLKAEKYDWILDLHKNLRSTRIKFQLGVRSLSFDKLNIEKWFVVNLKVNKLPSGVHLVDRYFDGMTSLGIKNDGNGLDFFVSELSDWSDENPYVVIALGAAHATKMMPYSLLRQLCRSIKLPIVTIGGPKEQELGHRLEEEFDNVKNLAGQCSLHQSAHIIQNGLALITPDTGMMHIAAALKKPILVFWGNTIPDFGMFPYYGVKEIPYFSAETGVSCRPCSKIGYPNCPKGHFKCMEDQNVQAAMSWLENLIKSTNAEQ